MSENPGPFRADAIASRSANQIGAVLLSRPKTFSLMVAIVGLVVAELVWWWLGESLEGVE